MEQDENEFYDDEEDDEFQEESQNLWEQYRGQTFDFGTQLNSPLKESKPSPPIEPSKLTLLRREKLRERTVAEVKRRAEEKRQEEKQEQERIAAAEAEALKPRRKWKFTILEDYPNLSDSLSKTPYRNNYIQLRKAFSGIWNEGPPVNPFRQEKKVYWAAIKQYNEWGKFLFGEAFMEFRKKDFIPRKWMLEDEIIKRRYDDPNDLDFQRLKTILNHIWLTILDRDKCIELAKKIGVGGVPKIEKRSKRDKQGQIIKEEKEEVRVERDYVFIAPLDFATIQKYGKGYSEGYVKQYMEEFARVGILKKFDKRTGPHGQTIYAIGYWSPAKGKNKFKAQPFLQNTEVYRTVLREFGLLRRKERRFRD